MSGARATPPPSPLRERGLAALVPLLAALCLLALSATSASAAAGPPVLSATSASGITETSATLGAMVDPDGKATRYRFEYITEAAYQANPEAERFAGAGQAPVPEATVPAKVSGSGDLEAGSNTVSGLLTTAGAFAAGQTISGPGIPAATTILAASPTELELSNAATATTPGAALLAEGAQPVSQPIEGLSPASAYRYRILATNNSPGNPVVAGPTRAFATYATPSAGLPDGRAYEQVTPVDKDGGDVTGPPSFLKAAIDGNAATFLSSGGVPGGEGAQELPLYLGSRGAGSWSTQGLLPPAGVGQNAKVIGWLPDFSQSFVVAESFATNPRQSALFARPATAAR